VTTEADDDFNALDEESAGAAAACSAVASASGAAIAIAMASVERLIIGHHPFCWIEYGNEPRLATVADAEIRRMPKD